MHVDDLADAALHLMTRLRGGELINVGTGTDLSMGELAFLISEMVGYEGTIVWNQTRPDGTPCKLLDVSRQKALGWEPRIELRAGIAPFTNGTRARW